MSIKSKLKGYSALVASMGAASTSVAQTGIYLEINQSISSNQGVIGVDLDLDGLFDFRVKMFVEDAWGGYVYNDDYLVKIEGFTQDFKVGSYSSTKGYLKSFLGNIGSDVNFKTDGKIFERGYATGVSGGGMWTTYSGAYSGGYYYHFSYTLAALGSTGEKYFPIKFEQNNHIYFGWVRLNISGYINDYSVEVLDCYLSRDPDREVVTGEALGPVSVDDLVIDAGVEIKQMGNDVLLTRNFDSKGMEVQLYDMMGRLISVHSVASNSEILSYNRLLPGIYVIKVTSEGHELKTQKIVFQ